ncbi:cytochrome d ubiquinol oxidase subunit II [Streptomyces sp. NBC_01591]|uniref:cytochrome d ubiquinol oxidase subunit II n=1 Tax=Streptomyces sp. NBC_01591 TaxID=2975888 RepID=UPI002DDB93EE|nr:cytochrome d ubiquinol oxidase subunit II [Streptomyces sp. NBC_01591]
MADLIAWVMVLAIAAYASAGGTDYGSGFWDLMAGGAERGQRPRWLIDHAMAPVWEVNNVWLIFVFVVMWTGFPTMFQAVFTAMWLPLALAAVGLVLRGAGFALHKPSRRLAQRRIYGAMFAISSLLTPFFLGAVLGGIASGRVAVGTTASTDAWANPTSVLAGLLAIAATAFLGAVFLCSDARRFGADDLVDYFRLRALLAFCAVVVLALIGLPVAHGDARYVWEGLTGSWGLLLIVLAAVCSLQSAVCGLRSAVCGLRSAVCSLQSAVWPRCCFSYADRTAGPATPRWRASPLPSAPGASRSAPTYCPPR